jgi:hypothetical protein
MVKEANQDPLISKSILKILQISIGKKQNPRKKVDIYNMYIIMCIC